MLSRPTFRPCDVDIGQSPAIISHSESGRCENVPISLSAIMSFYSLRLDETSTGCDLVGFTALPSALFVSRLLNLAYYLRFQRLILCCQGSNGMDGMVCMVFM